MDWLRPRAVVDETEEARLDAEFCLLRVLGLVGWGRTNPESQIKKRESGGIKRDSL